MANHVEFNISSDKPMEHALKTESFERDWGTGKITVQEYIPLHKQPFMQEAMKGVEIDADGWPKDSYSWHVDNIGAKWCNLEDGDENYLSGYSAWSPPVEMLGHLARYLNDNLRMSYIDEGYCFIGVAWADTDGDVDCEELEDGDLDTEIAEAMGLDELPDDFDMWEERDELDGQSGCDWRDNFVYNWCDSQ